MKKKLISLLALLLFAGVLFGVWYTTRPEPDNGEKSLTIEVIHGDGNINTFHIETDAEYLAEALVENETLSDEDIRTLPGFEEL